MRRLFLWMGLLIAGGSGNAMGQSTVITQRAIFAGGCFWCMEAAFEGTDGVVSVTSGYTAGHIKNPTYEQVSGGTSGHAEAIEVAYDPQKVNYDRLLEIYWSNIDPTDQGGQFADRGSQYRTGIFYFNNEQRERAELSKKNIEQKVGKPLYTEITAASEFYPAEDYHQNYYKKNTVRYNAYKYGSGRVSRLHELWDK